jgi:hypothetical protein
MDPRDKKIDAWPFRRSVTEAVLASRFTTMSSRNGQRRSSRTIGLLAFLVNRQGDESSVVRTSDDAPFVTGLPQRERNRSRKDGHDARARNVSAASACVCARSYASTRRWLKVNSRDETTSTSVACISRNTEYKCGTRRAVPGSDLVGLFERVDRQLAEMLLEHRDAAGDRSHALERRRFHAPFDVRVEEAGDVLRCRVR